MRSITTRIVARVRRSLGSNAKPVEPFHGAMTIEEAWRHHPNSPTVFAQHHLPACDGCAVRFDETLEEATTAYGLDLETFLADLNALRTDR